MGVDWEKTYRWIQKGDLKGCREALIGSAQEQALRTSYIKFYTDKKPTSRMCGEKGESVSHLSGKVVQTHPRVSGRKQRFQSSVRFQCTV